MRDFGHFNSVLVKIQLPNCSRGNEIISGGINITSLTDWGRDNMAAFLADDIFICIFLNENFRISNKKCVT